MDSTGVVPKNFLQEACEPKPSRTKDIDISLPEGNVHIRLCQFVPHDRLIRRKIEIYLTGNTKIGSREDGIQTLDARCMIDGNFGYCDISVTQKVTQRFEIPDDFDAQHNHAKTLGRV
jgi:hypothetical protein